MIDSEESELGTACAWIGRDLRRERDDRFPRIGRTERKLAADASRQSGWTNAPLLPRTEFPLDQPIFARMITDHCQRAAASQCVPEGREGTLETGEFVI